MPVIPVVPVVPVILSGGSGTRLWPLSRKQYPKQLLNLTGGAYTMLQETIIRTKHLQNPIIVCNEDHRFMAAEQSRNINVTPAAIILEPVGRNTAPAIALAAIEAQKKDANVILAIFPADHVIKDQSAFEEALAIAIVAAKKDKLVTFGIVADQPETGYGYIKAVANNKEQQNSVYQVDKFVEKPDQNTAQQYIDSGDYYWNSGMFVFKASVYMAALEKANPEIIKYCNEALNKANNDLDFIRIDQNSFEKCPDDSIDYAVMETAHNVVVVPMDAQWNDLGSWSSLWDIIEKDDQKNAFIGDVVAINTNNTLVHSSNSNKLIATIGLNNIVIVETADALLVADKNQMQDVKAIVNKLKKAQREEHIVHRKVQRPWGTYDLIDQGTRYKVKCLSVKPAASLSLQMHHHRAEHWVVVSGTAIVQIGDKEQILTENQSIYIPIGKTHRLTNPGTLQLELIEVQSGSYLGEDDIVRFEDNFGRCK